MMTELEEKQKARFALLRSLYEMSGGDKRKFVDVNQLMARASISETAYANAIQYLEGESLVKGINYRNAIPVVVSITHNGVVEVEKALRSPDQPTEHFSAINILFVKQMIGSSVQQGTTNSVQTTTINADCIGKIHEFIREVKNKIDEIAVVPEVKQEILADLGTLQMQADSPKPKHGILKESLQSLKRIFEGAVGGAIGTQLAAYIPPLLVLLGGQ